MSRFESKSPIVIAPEPCWSCNGVHAFVETRERSQIRLRCAADECTQQPPPFRTKVSEALKAWRIVARAEARARAASKAMRMARAEA